MIFPICKYRKIDNRQICPAEMFPSSI